MVGSARRTMRHPMAKIADNLTPAIARRTGAMRADLERYVNIPTGFNHTPGLEELRELVTTRCRALGARVELVPGEPRPDWLVADSQTSKPAPRATIPPAAICRCNPPVGGSAKPSILIASHLDTVFDPAGPFLKYQPSPDGARAVGPGVVDMKGGIVIALHALEALAECGLLADIPWTYFFNSDEETGSYHSRDALAAESRRHTWGLATEPALPDGSLAIERKGSGQFIVEAFGRSAHAGRDFEKGASAVYALARALTRVEALSDPGAGVTVNVGPLKGGAATNIVPDYAAAWGNVRFPNEQASERFRAGLEAINSGGDAEAPRVRVRHSLNRPAKPTTMQTERLALMAREVAASLGQQLPFASTGGVCDGNIMQDAGLPTIDSLGVRGGGLHTHDEWIDLGSLTERCALLAHLLLKLSRTPR